MKNRLFKKVFAAVLTVAMILTTNGVTAFAAKNVKVENVYANVKKFSMATGTTKQITTYTEPENATNQSVLFSSSNRKVATVTPDGIVKAIAPGKTTITVTSKDNVEAIEKVAVTVLDDLVINKDKLDSDGEVLLIDKTFGNVIVDSSIGDAPVYLSGIKITNKLSLELGKYKVFMYDSSAKAVEVVENADEITSFADVESTAIGPIPGLYVLSNSLVAAITTGLSLNLGQDGTSRINSFNVNQCNPTVITVDMNGFSGQLFVNSSATGRVLLNTQGCNIPSATVTGTTNSGLLQFNNRENSTIGSLLLGGSANVDLQVPATSVNIGSTSQGATLNVGAPIQALNNEGSGSSINLSAEVGTFTSTGQGSNIMLNEGGAIEEEELSSDTVIEDRSSGGSSGGAGGSSGGAGGAGGGSSVSETNTSLGAVIVNSNFDDKLINPNLGKRGSKTSTIVVDGGNNSASALLVRNRAANDHGVSIDLSAYTATKVSKHITVTLRADVMYMDGPDTAEFKATVDDGSWTQVASQSSVSKGEWVTLRGDYTIEGINPKLYIELDNINNYYVDNISLSITSVSPLVAVDTITITPATLTLGIGQQSQLSAAVLPDTAEDTSVVWYTSDNTIATVDQTGLVTALKGGSVKVYAASNAYNKKATCEIIIDPNLKIYAVRLNKPVVALKTIGATEKLTASALLNNRPYSSIITWESTDSSIVTVDQSGNLITKKNGDTTVTASITVNEDGVPHTYSASARVIVDEKAVFMDTHDEATTHFLPRGTSRLTVENGILKVTGRTISWHGAQYDIPSELKGKKVRVTADVAHGNATPTTVKLVYYNGENWSTQIASDVLARDVWGSISLTFDTANVNGTHFYFEAGNETCNIYLDNIILTVIESTNVTPTPSPTPITGALTFNDVAVDTTYNMLGTGTATVKAVEGDVANHVLEIMPGGYHSAAIVNFTIPEGKTLADYEKITYKALWKAGDIGWKDIIVEAGTTLTGQFNNEASRIIASYNRAAGATTEYQSESINLNGSLGTLSGTIQLAIGIHCDAVDSGGIATVYYLDDIVLIPKAAPATAQPIVIDFEGEPVTTSTIGLTAETITTTNMINELIDDFNFSGCSGKMLKVVSNGWGSYPKFGVKLPEGTILADYSSMQLRYYTVAGTDAEYKTAKLLADGNVIGSIDTFAAFPTSGAWASQTISIDAAKAGLVSGSEFDIAVGISADAGATYVLDDITLVSASGSAIVADFEGTAPTIGSTGGTPVTTTIISDADFVSMLSTNTSDKVLKLTSNNYDQAVKFNVTLAEGTTINDYKSLTFKVYLPIPADGNTGFFYKQIYAAIGENVTNVNNDLMKWSTEDKRGRWIEVSIDIHADMKVAVGTDTSFEVAIGCSTPETTPYYIDDIKLVP